MNNFCRVYALPEDKTIPELARSIKRYLANEEKMEVQILKLDNQYYLVLARTPSSIINTLAGMEKLISVKLIPIGENAVKVEIGRRKWKDKAIASGIGLLVSWPFLAIAAMGAYRQGSLPRKILSHIKRDLAVR